MNKNNNNEPIVDYHERKKGIWGVFSKSFEDEDYSDYSNLNPKEENEQINPYAIHGYEQDGEPDIEVTAEDILKFKFGKWNTGNKSDKTNLDDINEALTDPLKGKILIITMILSVIVMAFFVNRMFSIAFKIIEETNVPQKTTASIQREFAYQNHTEEEIKNLAETTEFEHEDVIKIPTLYKHSKYTGVEEYIHKIEDNEVAEESIVVKVKYLKNTKSNSIINDFVNKLVKIEGYEIKTGISKTKKILIRKEFDEYFTYIIIDNNVITYGLGKTEKDLFDYLYEAFDNLL